MNSEIWDKYHEVLYKAKMPWLRFLRSWCGGEIFIRELGVPYRKISKTVHHIHKQLLYFTDPRQHKEMPDVYLTVNAYEEAEEFEGRRTRERPVYDSIIWKRLFWDFDVSELSDLMRTLEEARRLWLHFDGKPNVIFSAHRGFHVYVCPDHPIVNDVAKIQKYQKAINEELKFETVDTISDVARVSRLPFIPHPKTSRFPIPVNFGDIDLLGGDPMEAILKESSEVPIPRPILPDYVEVPELKETE